MLKNAQPSKLFIGAILHAYYQESCHLASWHTRTKKLITCFDLWNQIVMQCLRMHKGFEIMFEWDESKTKRINRIGTIAETIRRGHVSGLRLVKDERGREHVRETS